MADDGTRVEDADGAYISVWRLDTQASVVAFRTRYAFVLPVKGVFSAFSGTIRRDENRPERTSIEIEIDAASLSTGLGLRDRHLRTVHFFDVKRFPIIRFAGRHAEADTDDAARVYGDLTVKGITREVVLSAERVEAGSDRQVWSATATLDRYDYGVTMGKVFEGFGTMVDNVVDVELSIVAVRAGAASRGTDGPMLSGGAR